MGKLKYYLPAIAWAGLIFWGSSFALEELPESRPYLSYAVHFLEFFVLGFLLVIPTSKARPNFQEAFAWAVFLGLSYSFVDELHQSYVPGRSVELTDMAFDFVGGVAGALTYGFFHPSPRKHSNE